MYRKKGYFLKKCKKEIKILTNAVGFYIIMKTFAIRLNGKNDKK